MSITKETRTVAPCPYGDGYGITLREHFAGLAMQGLLAANDTQNPNYAVGSGLGCGHAAIANAAVSLADALLAELDKQK